MRSLTFPVLIILLIGFINGCDTPLHFTKDLPMGEALTPASLASGQALFQKHCVRCHGEQGQGNGPEAKALMKPPANLVKSDIHVSVMNMALIIEAPYHSKLTMGWNIADGKGEMAAWKEILSEAEINDLTNYIKYLQFRTEALPEPSREQ